jgi:pyruvate dehydrogenase E2 component (dihydrolipoamide acetyltransferase)
MPIEIRMPALSPTMSEGNLARWLKKEGDAVAAGDIIAEIETDKATMEFEAVDEGRLGRILVPDGTEGVPVNQPIGILLEEGENEEALKGFEAGEAPAAPAANAKPEKPPKEAKAAPRAAEARPGEGGGRPASEAVARPAKGNGAAEGRIFASPLARRMAEQAGIELSMLEGSGPHGRIVKRDIEQAMRAGGPA